MYRTHTTAGNKKNKISYIVITSISIAFSLWLFWIIINPSQKGTIGNFVFENLFSFMGYSIYLFPFLFFYGILRLLIKSTKAPKGIITMLLGISLILFFTSVLIENFSYYLNIKSGWIGYALDTLMVKLFGKIGSIFFSLAFIVIGLNIVFDIKWSKIFEGIKKILKKDYEEWQKAKAELKIKFNTLREKERNGEKIIAAKPIASTTKLEENKIQVPTNLEKEKQKINQPISKINEKETKDIHQKIQNKKERPKNFLDFKNFKFPDIELLNKNKESYMPNSYEIEEAKIKLEETLKNFQIDAYISGIYPGPVITRYEVTPSPGVKISSIVSLSNDIALALKSIGSIRAIAPIPGKSAIGFEIPNARRSIVNLREVIESSQFNANRKTLTFALGKHTDGSIAIADLEEMPHLLVAGATGSGKSVFLHSLIISIIYRNTPDEVKFLLIDPKRLELTSYDGIPYLYDPRVRPQDVKVITDAKEAAKSLVALTKVMEKRYKKFESVKAKNIQSYNKWALANGERQEFYIVVVIDELADLILQAKNMVEEAIQRLTQMARAVGIHVVVATQRPSVDVITGVIKANLPARIALQVSSKVDSRVIIDIPGAETLIGKGDMLYLGPNTSKPERIQGCYVSEEEIERIVSHLKTQGLPNYEVLEDEEEMRPEGKGASSEELLQALRLIMERKRVSQDLLKAHFGSSARATNLLSLLEVKGFIYKPEGTNRWQIYFDKIEEYLKNIEKK